MVGRLSRQYDDAGFTGANTERPAFQKLLSDIDAGKIDIVLVYKVDRLSRSLLDFAKVMDRFNQKGIAFVSVTQNFSTADAMGRLTLNMLMSFAEFKREMIGERTRNKIAAARRKGKWTGGQVPPGYDVQDKKLVINDLEAVVVHEIFDQSTSTSIINRRWQWARNSTTKAAGPRSYQAKNGRVSGGQKWGKDAVLRILKNGIYAGYMPYGDELHEAEHEAIIDRERFMKIGSLLEGSKKNGHRHGNNPDYLLRGILGCDQCGAVMTPASTRKKRESLPLLSMCSARQKRNQGLRCPSDSCPGHRAYRIRNPVGRPGHRAFRYRLGNHDAHESHSPCRCPG